MSEAGPGHAERVMWLRLARTEGLGAVGFARLIARYVTAEAALDALPGRCRKAGKPVEFITMEKYLAPKWQTYAQEVARMRARVKQP